ncbi:polynucleotide adenylyltransferase PcnB [Glaciecola sp. 1036]|uniref:polynucleotide adenylyltransferase PcnB n=1 Tax=Alteromonadaceae TaxID=72275 RepID=UPI003D078199
MSNTRLTKLTPTRIPKSRHNLRSSALSENAVTVLSTLNDAGFDAYVVGGWVRDSLLGMSPKDVDIVTNATPEQIKGLFKNCRLIGRRFRLAHVYFGREILEVATYRGHHTEDSDNELSQSSSSGQLVRDNVFGSIEEDAARRDFSLNAMYFDARSDSILDFANGMASLKEKTLTMIGELENRFTEDPVRMLRAVRFSNKLDMQIPTDMTQAIIKFGHLLATIPPARLFEEINKLFLSGKGQKALDSLIELSLMKHLFPTWAASAKSKDSKEYHFARKMLTNTDERIATNNRVTPAFLYATILWYSLEEKTETLVQESNLSRYDAINIAVVETLTLQCKRVMIPKRFSVTMREIWSLQYRLTRRFGKKPFALIMHAKFRAAYDFLCLRAEVEGGQMLELAEWWTDFQKADQNKKRQMVLPSKYKGKRAKNSRR